MSVLRRLRNDERGIGLPLAMWMLLLAMTFAGTAIASALQGLHQSSQDVGRKKAAAGARAGLRMGVYRLNQTNLDVGATLRIPLTVSQCLVKLPDLSLQITTVTSSQWCSTDLDLGDGTTVTIQTSPVVNLNALGALAVGTFPALLQRKIVATGVAQGERRRMYLEARATGSLSVIAILGVPLALHAELQRYAPVAGSLRECTPVPTVASDPASGC